MKKTHFDERGMIPIIVIGIVALFTLGSVVYLIRQNLPNDQGPNAKISGTADPLAEKAENTLLTEKSEPFVSLRTEMEMALKSGGINPARFVSIEREIDELAANSVDVSDLRALLTRLSVGGSEKPKTSLQETPPPSKETARVETRPFWEYDPSKPDLGWYWARDGAPPACPEPLIMESPMEVSLATGILYPGQVRGDGPKDFKPHGGFTLKPGSKIELKAPMDGYLTNVAKFTDEFGYHVGLTFQHPCGIQFGGGHWGALPPDIQAVVDTVPLKGFRESRTEQIVPPYFVKKGQVIVTGLQEKAHPERPGFDWGIADYRQPNAASKDPRFRELYGYAPWNTYYGVCWLDILPADQKAVLKSLPGVDGKQGKNSEYCK